MTPAMLALLPAAVLLDRLLGEPPSCAHPVRLMGALAVRLEAMLRHGPNNMLMSLYGVLACLLVVLPSVAVSGGLVFAARLYAGQYMEWAVAVALTYICLAPRSLDEHARRVAEPLIQKDLKKARKAVSMIVGRNTTELDAHGVARACVESVGENLTDGVLSTLFWAGLGLFFFGYPGAASLAFLHRSANILDALWGKKNEKYIRFGTCAARLDDALNFIPARLSLPCIAIASLFIPGLRHKDSLSVGWKYRTAHASFNSAWSEAAFAGALGLKLGGPVTYGATPQGLRTAKGSEKKPEATLCGVATFTPKQQLRRDIIVDHPWLGDGTLEAEPEHIILSIRLMWYSVIVFTVLEVFSIGMTGIIVASM